MSRVLLIQSPYLFPSPVAHLSEPLGIEYLAASLRQAGHETKVYDPTLVVPEQRSPGMYFYGTSAADMAGQIRSFSPDIVGISCHYAYGAADAYEVAQIAKQVNISIITVMGGLYVSTHGTRPLIECDCLDYCLVGEGDASFPALLQHIALQSPECLDKIDGLLWRDSSGVRQNEKTSYISDLDSLPFPARDLVQIEKYMTGSTVNRLYGLGFKPALSLLTSRSCPNRCSFCNMRLVHGTRWRARSADNVLAELDEMILRYKAEHVFFMDDNFTLDPDRAKLICEKIVRKGYPFRWNTPNGISVKGMDPDLAKLMKQSGCANVCIAIESGSEYIRNEVMRKNTTDAQIVNAVTVLKAAGLPVVGFIILGMPGETEDHFQKTVSFLQKLPLTSLVATLAIPFPGTDLHVQLKAQGLLKNESKLGMDDLNSVSYETADFSAADLIRRRTMLREMFPGLVTLYELEQKATSAN